MAASVFFPSTREALGRWPGTRPFNFGPPPEKEPDRPWLRNGGVAPTRRGPRILEDPPAHLRAAARPTMPRDTASPPPAAWPRSRAIGGGSLNRPPPAPKTCRGGPCDERSLPLTRHTLRAEAQPTHRRGSVARPWLPPTEWKVSRQRDGTPAKAPTGVAVPLGGFSPQVVKQCEAHTELSEPIAAMWKATDGGWASEVPIQSDMPPAPPPDHCRRAWDDDITQWPLEPETVLGRHRVAAGGQPRGTLALVDRFLGSDVAAAFIPE